MVPREDKFPTRDQISIGCQVSIKNRATSSVGVVKEVLTRADNHPHGIMVLLEDGTKGRVQEVLQSLRIQEPPTHLGERHQVNLDQLLQDREGPTLEFKESAFWSKREQGRKNAQKTNSPEVQRFGAKASIFLISRAVASLMNSRGGQVLIGVREDKISGDAEVVGIEHDFEILKDPNTDGFRREVVNGFQNFLPAWLTNRLDQHIQFDFMRKDTATVCCLSVRQTSKPVFVTVARNDEEFFIRVDTTTKSLKGAQLADYLASQRPTL